MDPSAVDAAPAGHDDEAVGQAVIEAGQALGWLVGGVDLSAVAASTDRCLAAGPACAAGDLLDLDTSRLRLAALADSLGHAIDPADPGFLGQADGPTVRRATQTRAAASSAADALGQFLATGCGGSVDGVAVAKAPAGCEGITTGARNALDGFRQDVRSWPEAAAP
jgi:hypothetical protein